VLQAQDQKHIFVAILLKLFKNYKSSAVLELTKECNLHCHGLIEFCDHKHLNKFMNRCRLYNKDIGRHPANQVIDYDRYTAYMRKSLEQTRLIIGDPIVSDYFCVLGDICHHGFQDL